MVPAANPWIPLWREHLVTLDHLRQVIGLRGYGQRDPLNEYKTETFVLFETLLTQLREDVTAQMFHVEPMSEEEIRAMEEGREDPEMEMHHMDLNLGYDEGDFDDDVIDADYGEAASPQDRGPQRPKLNKPKGVDIDPKDDSTWGKVPRNAPCPCSSGKKFKHCHGRLS